VSNEESSPNTVDVSLPHNVHIGRGTKIVGDHLTAKTVFRRFKSNLGFGLVIGEDGRMDGVAFNVGERGSIRMGNQCEAYEAYLIAESEILIGDRVYIGWHATLADSDFHPVDPDARMKDGFALSPLGKGLPREKYVSRPIIVENDVWIGPNAVILKGVRIGTGAVVEPGAVVVKDVPAGARVMGNPAQIIDAGNADKETSR